MTDEAKLFRVDTAKRLSFFQKVIYGSGDWSLSSFTTLRAFLYTIFLVDVVRLDPGLASISAFIGMLWDAINDPLVGTINDRLRTRWGRRRPFLLLFAIPFALGFMVLWWSPPTDSQWIKFLYVTLAFLIGDTLHTLINVPYLALVPEISRDYDERTALSGFRVFFNLVASLVTVVAAPTIVDDVVRSGFAPQQGYLLVAAIFGGIAAIPFLVIPFIIHERTAELDEPDEMIDLRQMWRVLLRNRPFRYVTGLYTLTWIAFDLVTRMIPFFLIYWVGRGDTLISRPLLGSDFALESLAMGALMIVAVISIPLWISLSQKFSKRNAYIAGMVFWVVVLAALMFVQPGQIGLTLLLAALAGLSVSTASVLPESMLPDAVDWDEYTHGERNEGLFFGAITFFRKLSGAIAGFLALQALSISGYLAPPEGVHVFEQAPSALNAIRLLTGPFSALLVIGAIVVAWFYPLDRRQYAEVRHELDRRRAEKSKDTATERG